jgi:hypothetical protein
MDIKNGRQKWTIKMDTHNEHYKHTLINTIFEHLQPMNLIKFQ